MRRDRRGGSAGQAAGDPWAAIARALRGGSITALAILQLIASPRLTAAETARGTQESTGAVEEPVSRAPEPVHYLFPDVPARALIYDGKRFAIRPLFAFVSDYTWFSQDEESRGQVGKQDDKGELRAGRLGLSLHSKSRLSWDFYCTVDYQERKNREKAVFQVYDLTLAVPIGPIRLTVGKMKEPISYELSGLSVLLPQQERILLPFFPTRSIGVKLSGHLAGDRVTWAAGAFNDYLDSGVARGRNGNDYVGRVTALAWESSSDKTRYVHLGLGYRRVGSDDGVMRFSGRPESNVADKYVDTGNFAADHADELSLELLLSHGPYSLLAERFDARVKSPETGDPRFSGYYAAASWILTGEGRTYIPSGGYASGVTPTSRYGALELVVRYSHLDITDGTLDGGLLDKWHLGLNWWTSPQWKVGIGWGDADLDKKRITGNTKMVLVRLQWLY